jgi:cell division septation protein DedD
MLRATHHFEISNQSLMPKKTNEELEQLAEFDLKHRVTGAAVLLFLGALVMPWLLGPPSEASKVEIAQQLPTISEVEVANIVAPANSSSSGSYEVNSYGPEPMNNEIEETVYISKITPLDAKGNSDLVKAARDAAESTQVRQQQNNEANALAEVVRQQNEVLEKAAAEKITSDEADANKSLIKDASKNLISLASDQLQTTTAQAIEPKPQPLKSSDQEQEKTTVDVGWVVQVGLFTDKSRAIALISELKNNGFNASSSVVDTNRGKKTGTRVWLGPFTKRVAAIKQQKSLKAKAGKEGFIRVYP